MSALAAGASTEPLDLSLVRDPPLRLQGDRGRGHREHGVQRGAVRLRERTATMGQQRSQATRVSRRVLMLFAVTAWGAAGPAFGWIYPEHRDIAVLAVQGLDPERKAVLDRFWQEARTGDEQRMCPLTADAEQGITPPCIDWAALAAIAGDHSCSSADMLEIVRKSAWILTVADVAAQLKADLAGIPVTARPDQAVGAKDLFIDAQRRIADEASRAQRLNALRAADTRLQRADPQYATRADANLAHFLIPRPDTNLDPIAYGALALRPGSDLNAIGVYAWFHISAMQKASRLASEQLSPGERRALVRAMLFDEAFALHFLEDVFAAGHVAGSWGDVSQRKGTHDHYNQNGLEVFTWQGRERTIVLMGDAHMRPQDAALAAATVRTSIAQVLDTATGRSRGYSVPHAAAAPASPDSFDVCKNLTFPERGVGLGTGGGQYAAVLREALLETPVPGLGPGLGSLPRARSEVGVFMGVAASIAGRAVDGGFVSGQDSAGFVAGLDLGFRVGLGLEGALGDAGDGLVFLQAGLTVDGASTNKFSDAGTGAVGGSLTAAIPSRSGLSTRIRMPFYAIPGDLLWLAPLYLFDPEKYAQLAVTASNGGVLGWQQGWATGIGRFQFVLGRELGVTFYGLWGDPQLLAPPATPGTLPRAVNFKSAYFEVPIVEYRPYRAFSANQSSAILFQLFAAADVPYDTSVAAPAGAPLPNFRTVWSIGLRMTFDWRHYR